MKVHEKLLKVDFHKFTSSSKQYSTIFVLISIDFEYYFETRVVLIHENFALV